MQFRLRRLLLWTFGVLAVLAALAAAVAVWYLQRSQEASFWAPEIAAFEARESRRCRVERALILDPRADPGPLPTPRVFIPDWAIVAAL